MRKRFLLYGLLLIVAVGASCYFLFKQANFVDPQPVPSFRHAATVEEQPAQPTSTAFNKDQQSLTAPDSLWLVVNKQRPLAPQNYTPADLVTPKVPLRTGGIQVRQAVAHSLEQLFAAAERNGTPLRLSSGYRSYTYQVGLYNGYVASEGQEAADAESARPGFSEHQTGLAADVTAYGGGCNLEQCFGDTATGKWLAVEAHKYGFIIRYPNGKTAVTGYAYEPWHLRYVGAELAAEMQAQGTLTLEEFFGLPSAPTY